MADHVYLRWRDLVKELDIKDHEFFEYLKAGLQPYTEYNQQPIPCPEEYHEYYRHCSFFSTLEKIEKDIIEKGKEETFYVTPANSLYDDLSRLHLYDHKDIDNLYFTYKHIEELKKRTKDDRDTFKRETGIDPADKTNLYTWKFFLKPKLEKKCEEIKSNLIEKAVFKRGEALKLYKSFDSGITEIGPQIRNIVNSAMPELEVIYNAMKNDLGFSGRLSNPEAAWEKAAKNAFNKQKDKFKLLRFEDLEDKKLYELTIGQEARKFYSYLLQKIVKRQTGQKIGGQKLYKLFKKIND